VALKVVDREQRQPVDRGDRLRRHQPDHEPADQPGPGGRRNRVEVGEAQPRLGHGAGAAAVEREHVGAGGDLGDDAAVGPVLLQLAHERRGEHPAGAVHQRDGGLVAARLDPEHDIGSRCLRLPGRHVREPDHDATT
jgi:hypothetical protein